MPDDSRTVAPTEIAVAAAIAASIVNLCRELMARTAAAGEPLAPETLEALSRAHLMALTPTLGLLVPGDGGEGRRISSFVAHCFLLSVAQITAQGLLQRPEKSTEPR